MCKIADFGTAILTINGNIKGDDIRGTPGESVLALLMSTFSITGFPSAAFMAPELFTTLKSYSGFKADVYSLGVTLYNMVVGAPPFMAKNEIELVELVKSTEIRIPTDSLMDPHLRCVFRCCAVVLYSVCLNLREYFPQESSSAHGCKESRAAYFLEGHHVPCLDHR